MDYYHFKRGDRVIITTGSYQGCTGTIDSAVFQRTVDQPDEYAPGYHVVLDDGAVVAVRSGFAAEDLADVSWII